MKKTISHGVDNKILGKALKRVRKMAGMTQTELAEKIQIKDATYLSKLENGKRNISVKWVYLYGTATELGVDRIIEEAFNIAGHNDEYRKLE